MLSALIASALFKLSIAPAVLEDLNWHQPSSDNTSALLGSISRAELKYVVASKYLDDFLYS